MSARRRNSLPKTVFIAGLVAGTLDILDPILFYGIRSHTSATLILHSIAAALLGPSAYTGGLPTAALGLAIHFTIALFWAALYIVSARELPALRHYAVPSGLLYGAFIYIVMNHLVLPHTKTPPHGHPAGIVLLNGILAAVLLVGLPISILNQRLA